MVTFGRLALSVAVTMFVVGATYASIRLLTGH
jgi:hypothetical protein